MRDFKNAPAAAATGCTTQPDYWLEGELSSMPGIIIEKTFAEKEGKELRHPGRVDHVHRRVHAPVVDTGVGVGVVAVRNPHYWNSSVHPLAGRITIKGVALTEELLTGAIQGDYGVGLPTLSQLKHSGAVRVYLGPGWSSDVLEITSLKGALGNLNVRRRCPWR